MKKTTVNVKKLDERGNIMVRDLVEDHDKVWLGTHGVHFLESPLPLTSDYGALLYVTRAFYPWHAVQSVRITEGES